MNLGAIVRFLDCSLEFMGPNRVNNLPIAGVRLRNLILLRPRNGGALYTGLPFLYYSLPGVSAYLACGQWMSHIYVRGFNFL